MRAMRAAFTIEKRVLEVIRKRYAVATYIRHRCEVFPDKVPAKMVVFIPVLVVIIDEMSLWIDTPTMNFRKFFDELTTVPTREEPLTIIITYAGFDKDGSVLGELVKRAEAGTDSSLYYLNLTGDEANPASWI